MSNEQPPKPTNNEVKAMWKEELLSSTAVQRYFNGFDAKSIKEFLSEYLFQKSLWHIGPDINRSENDEIATRWVTIANLHLGIIQQKKLFDAQCLWRADKLHIEEIQISKDFDIWQCDILNCPFIEPVNENDVDMYCLYLQHADADVTGQPIPWQNMWLIKDAYESKSNMMNFPEWYDFHNGRTNGGALMVLPDVRAEKENFYLVLNAKHLAKENKTPPVEIDYRPLLEFSRPGYIEWFVATYEDKKTQIIYKDFNGRYDLHLKKEHIKAIIEELFKAHEPVPIEANLNWIDALEEAMLTYRRNKIAEALPQALEQYQLMISMGIAFEKGDLSYYEMVKEKYAAAILHGRKLNGEPEDFNF